MNTTFCAEDIRLIALVFCLIVWLVVMIGNAIYFNNRSIKITKVDTYYQLNPKYYGERTRLASFIGLGDSPDKLDRINCDSIPAGIIREYNLDEFFDVVEE